MFPGTFAVQSHRGSVNVSLKSNTPIAAAAAGAVCVCKRAEEKEREGCKLGGRYFDGHILCEKRRRGREVVTCASVRRGQWKEGPHLRRLETESGQQIKAARHRPTFQNARRWSERVLAAGDRGGQIRGALISCNLPSLAAHCPSAISSVASSKLRGGTLCRRCPPSPPSSSVMPSHSCRSIEHRGRRNSREEEEEGIKG